MFSWFKRKKKEELSEELKSEEGLSEEAVEGAEARDSDVEEGREALSEAEARLTEFSELPHGEERELAFDSVQAEPNELSEEAQVEPIAEPAEEVQVEPVAEPVEEAQVEPIAEPVEEAQAEAEEKKQGLFSSLFSGLNKTRKKIGDQIDNLLNNYREIDEELYEEIEDILITADIGMTCTMDLIDRLKDELEKRKIKDAGKVKSVLRDVMAEYLKVEGSFELADRSPTVILVIGVNGAGKTTSIGKLSHKLKNEGKKVVLAAADTFRAAAIDQLKVWAERAGVGFVAHTEGSDPSAVIFDGIKSAQAKNADVLICDTAGRLHNKVNLMNELNKMFRIIEREYPEAHKEVLLVLDATTGQNAINQAKEFLQSAGITGIVLTKLDGTAKGGFVFAIRSELGIPVKLVGVGEKIEDLQSFDPESYANAILNL